MKELFCQILVLLDHHSCVIVPNLGGFVVNERGAQRKNDSFVPPCKEIIFNQLLVHNDGLLVQELMKMYGESFEEANNRLALMVEDIKMILNTKGVFPVSDWGQLVQEDGKIYFRSQQNVLTNRNAYGLREFYFPTIQEEPKDEGTFKKSIRPLLVGTAAAITLLMFFHPVSDDSISYNSASMMMANLQTEVAEKYSEISLLQRELNAYKDSPVGFYLVLTDFDSMDKAQLFVKENQLRDFESLEVLSIDQRYYVSVVSSMSKNDLMEKKVELTDMLGQFPNMYILSVAKMKE